MKRTNNWNVALFWYSNQEAKNDQAKAQQFTSIEYIET